MTKTSNEDDLALQRVLCVHYLICFKKKEVRALIDSSSEINAISLAYASRLGLQVYCTDIGAQKTDGSTFQTFEMVLANFQVEDKPGRARFFQETFFLIKIGAKVILGMPFLTLSNANVQFVEKELTWRSYTTTEAPLITK